MPHPSEQNIYWICLSHSLRQNLHPIESVYLFCFQNLYLENVFYLNSHLDFNHSNDLFYFLDANKFRNTKKYLLNVHIEKKLFCFQKWEKKNINSNVIITNEQIAKYFGIQSIYIKHDGTEIPPTRKIQIWNVTISNCLIYFWHIRCWINTI